MPSFSWPGTWYGPRYWNASCATLRHSTNAHHGATGPHRECQVKAPGVGSGGLDLDLALTWACLGKLGLACRRINITIAWLGPLIANLGQNWTPTEHKGRHSNAACAKSGPRQAHVGPSGPDVGLTWGLTWPTWAGLPAKSGPRQDHVWHSGHDVSLTWGLKWPTWAGLPAKSSRSRPRQAHVGPSGPDVGLTWSLTWPTWAGLPPSQGHVRAMSGPCRAFRH